MIKIIGIFMEEFIFQVRLFVFIFSILYLIKYSFKCITVLRLKTGKIDNSTVDLILLGSALSYIITTLIGGF